MLKVLDHVSMLPFNTFHIDVKARYFAEIDDLEDLKEAIATGQLSALSKQGLLLLGGGSNLLFTRDYDGLVLHIKTKGIECHLQSSEAVLVKAAAGENWHDFVTYCVNLGYPGLENLSLIPGQVGSCPIQNIGAYGVEMKDSFHSLEALVLQTGELRVFTMTDCRFGYRDSIFKKELKGKVAIVSVTFQLNTHTPLRLEYGTLRQQLTASGITHPDPAAVSSAVCQIRHSKLPDPAIIGNAGSFFKNLTIFTTQAEALRSVYPNIVTYPVDEQHVKIAAGWLIEHCGWKGYRDGDAGVHQNQALVLVNYGLATGSQILSLAHKIQNSVYERFSIQLEMEVNIL